jgi:SagB-type dehydrogenase family enzyme
LSERRYRISRFTYVRLVADELVAETPLSNGRVALSDPAWAAALHALTQPCTPDELAARLHGTSRDEASAMFSAFLEAGLLTAVGPDGADDETGSLQTWEFHDLVMHARSRAGRNDAPSGGTYRFAGRLDPPPALPREQFAESIELERPELSRMLRNDQPYAAVQESRLSQRHFDADRPITIVQLSELLFRVGRVVDVSTSDIPTAAGTVELEYAARPFPSAGALYELDLYVAVNTCAGLGGGLYAYDPVEHRLGRIAGSDDGTRQIVDDSARAAGIDSSTVQTVLIMSARFSRLAWKYESIAYSLLLKNVGVLMATTYLAGTAMGIATCALGRGDSDLFARTAGFDYYERTSVGELLLGSSPG